MQKNIICLAPEFGPPPPLRLKDFLREEDSNGGAPCSSNNSVMTALLRRSRSRRVSALESVIIDAVKKLPAMKKFRLRKLKKTDESNKATTVQIKDIIRWTSFRMGSADETPSSRPQHECSNSTTTTSSSSSSCSSSNGSSSWSESDFTTLDFSPAWKTKGDFHRVGEYEENLPNLSPSVRNKDSVEAPSGGARSLCFVETKRFSFDEEKEHDSPVSVFDVRFGEDESCLGRHRERIRNWNLRKDSQSLSSQLGPLQRSANARNLIAPMDDVDMWSKMEAENEFKQEEQKDSSESSVGERARMLLQQARASDSAFGCKTSGAVDKLLLDFFRSELCTPSRKNEDHDDDECKSGILSAVRSWIIGENEGKCEWGIKGNKEAYLREMDSAGTWSKFEEEKEDIAVEVETRIVNILVDELLVDLLKM